MPGRDGTGPMGQGAKTGRGLGNCASQALPVIAGIAAGLCFGFGRRNRQNRPGGRGFGRGLRFNSPPADDGLEK